MIDIKEDKGQGWNGLIILPFDFICRNYKKNCSSHCVKFLKVDVEKKRGVNTTGSQDNIN